MVWFARVIQLSKCWSPPMIFTPTASSAVSGAEQAQQTASGFGCRAGAALGKHRGLNRGPEARLPVDAGPAEKVVLHATTLREASRPSAVLACRIVGLLNARLVVLLPKINGIEGHNLPPASIPPPSKICKPLPRPPPRDPLFQSPRGWLMAVRPLRSWLNPNIAKRA